MEFLPEDYSRTSNFEFINLMFPKYVMENEAVWMIGTYIEYAWIEKVQKKRNINVEKLIGHFKLCYRANQVARKPSLGYIVNIS